jgi:hypothetical protein
MLDTKDGTNSNSYEDSLFGKSLFGSFTSEGLYPLPDRILAKKAYK